MKILLALLLTISACTTWSEEYDAFGWTVATVETEDAARICSAIRGDGAVACAVRWTERKRCTEIVPPGDANAAAHEARHCKGEGHS